jgi:hypothetical protein
MKNHPVTSAPCNLSKTCPPATNEEFHVPSLYDGMTDNNVSDSDSDCCTILPHPTKNPPVNSVPCDPSKTCLPKHMVDNDLPIPIRGGGGTTQYQPYTDDDDNDSDLPLSNQGSGFTSHYQSPQRTADELPTVEDTLIPGRHDKSKQSMPPVHTSSDYLSWRVVYVPFPPSSGRGVNTYYPCPRGCQHVLSMSRVYV